MNILLVTMSMQIGGAETHVLELAKGLKRRGYTVYVMSNGGEYVTELEKNNIEHINAPMHNRKINNIFKSHNILKRTIVDKKIDIVHVHARIPGMIANSVCKSINIPMVATAHGIYRVNPILKLLTSWGEKTIAVSEDVKAYLINEYNVKAENVFVTVNGIDTVKFNKNTDYSDIIKEFQIANDKKRVVHISRLDSETSIVANYLIDMAENFKDAQFIIVGSGTEYEKLKNKADKINEMLNCKRVIMTGGRIDINKFDALADVFVGVSRAALEAMSAEVNTVLAGNQGYLGIFNDTVLKKALETNFCCRGLDKPKYERLMADIERALNYSDNEKYKMGLYNRKVVEKYYSVDKMIDDAIKMYESI